MHAVRTDDDRGPQRRPGRPWTAAPHTRGPAVRPDHLTDHEAFDQVGAGVGGRLDHERVEDGPPRAVGVGRACHRRPDAGHLHRAGVEGDLADGRATAGAQAAEQPPGLQPGCAPLPEEMGRHGVAGKRRPVDESHPVPGPGQQHGQRRPGAPGAHHDDVVRRTAGHAEDLR